MSPTSRRDHVPYVFVHCGASWYLPYSLRQAAWANGRHGVVLIHDAGARIEFGGMQAVPLDGLTSTLGEEFVNCYEHMSTNPFEYELICWLQWFYLLEYMETEGLGAVFYLDSDVLAYRSTAYLLREYSDLQRGCALTIPDQDHASYRWVANGCVSYWTIDALRQFCDFALDSFRGESALALYREKWEWHREGSRAGGINDMTGLYLFWREDPARATNLAAVHRGGMFDAGLLSPDNHTANEYDFDAERGHKKVLMVGRRPVLSRCGESVAAHALHFAGATRKYMPRFYSGPLFAGHVRRRLGSAWRRCARMVRG